MNFQIDNQIYKRWQYFCCLCELILSSWINKNSRSHLRIIKKRMQSIFLFSSEIFSISLLVVLQYLIIVALILNTLEFRHTLTKCEICK